MGSSLANTARIVVAAGADPAPFSIPYAFYSNGKCGHRHVSLDCAEFHSKCKLIEHTYTLLELKHLCEPCTRSVLDRATLYALDDAALFEEQLAVARGTAGLELDTVTAFALLEEHRRLTAMLGELRDHEMLEGYIPWCEARLNALHAAVSEAADGGREQLLFVAATDIAFRNADPGASVREILGRHGNSTLYQALQEWWGAEMATHGTASYATRRLLDRVADVVPEDVGQLKFTTSTPYQGETMETFVRRCWHQQVSTQVHDLTRRWADEYRNAQASTSLHAMALELGDNPTGLFASFLAAYTETRIGRRYIVVAPQLVITWLSHNARGLRRVPELVAIPDDFDAQIRAVTETAATLWDPASPGATYERFGTAFTAAACL